MAGNILDKQFDVLSTDEITESNDIQKALALINKEKVIEAPVIEPMKKFVVEKNKEITELINSATNEEEKTNAELDEISAQADQAFYDVMDMVVGIGTPSKGMADMASAAQSFLDIKLKSKIAKTELKLKRLKQELDEKKLYNKDNDNQQQDEEVGDDIIVIDRSKI